MADLRPNFLHLPPIFHSVFPIVNSSEGNVSDNCWPRRLNGNAFGRTMYLGAENTSSLKTTLLFQAAVSVCNYGEKVLFICPKPLNKLPSLVHGMPSPTLDNMANLKLIYIEELHILTKYLASFHEKESSLPVLIILDKLDYYVTQIQGSSHLHKHCAKLCALLQETAHFCSTKRQCCSEVLVSCKKNDLTIKVLHIFTHFFTTIWHIHLPKEADLPSRVAVSMTQLNGNTSISEIVSFYQEDDAVFLDSVQLMSIANR